MSILDSLNSAQKEAVIAEDPYLLVLAGAGSGKTRVLVHRIAWLMEKHQISPQSIFAVTFTNKAANEMRGRVSKLLGIQTSNMWIGTFHGLAHRFLRSHWREANLPESFQIIDSEDQLRLIRRVLKNLDIDEKQWAPKQAQYYINRKKEQGLRPHHITPGHEIYERIMLNVYQAYEETCKQSGVIDFAEMLLSTYELWRDHEEILDHYRQRFKHILVDEFQDTNTIQYDWMRLLTGSSAHFMIVGDDDQSIYGWRGAKVENIYRLQQDFPQTRLIRLEQNYRSTNCILETANTLIANNSGRMGKHLWTDGVRGDPITIYEAYNDRDEAQFVVNRIVDWVQTGNSLNECAILYRSNAQSRVIEEVLVQKGIPYRVYGGMRFFERAEIKDALAYLRLVANKQDTAAFERIINVPTRGIGEQTLAVVREISRDEHVSMWMAGERAVERHLLSARAQNAWLIFIDLIKTMTEEVQCLPLHEQVACVLNKSGLIGHYAKEKMERGQSRIENLEELISAARQFESEADKNFSILSEFLAYTSLGSPEDREGNLDNNVQLMTLHSAKGLEFPLVFITGMEEGLFPSQMSLESPEKLEEERRLCYVGITRAMKKLYFTYAEIRRLHGHEMYQRISRFLRELPQEGIEIMRTPAKVSRPIYCSKKRDDKDNVSMSTYPVVEHSLLELKIGQYVSHHKFGEGVILDLEMHGSKVRVQVRFKRTGTKWLDAEMAKLKVI